MCRWDVKPYSTNHPKELSDDKVGHGDKTKLLMLALVVWFLLTTSHVMVYIKLLDKTTLLR